MKYIGFELESHLNPWKVGMFSNFDKQEILPETLSCLPFYLTLIPKQACKATPRYEALGEYGLI